jgi:hypothetical protein
VNAKDILIFNKDGNPHNLVWDDARGIWTGKVMFDPNGSDTYKTAALYVLERVGETDAQGQFSLRGMQYFAPGARTYKGGRQAAVSKVETPNASALFNTKWVTAANAQVLFAKGDIVRFTGKQPYALAADALYAVLDVRKDQVLLQLGPSNDVAPKSTLLASGIESLNAVVSALPYYPASWNADVPDADVAVGDRVTLVNTAKNDGTYTVLRAGDRMRSYRARFAAADVAVALPAATATVTLRLSLYSDLPTVFAGPATFYGNSNSNASSVRLASRASALVQPGVQLTSPLFTVYTPTVREVSDDRKTIFFDGPIDSGIEGKLRPNVVLQLDDNTLTFSVAADASAAVTAASRAEDALSKLVTVHRSMLAYYGLTAAYAAGELACTSTYLANYVRAELLVDGVAVAPVLQDVPSNMVLAVDEELDAEYAGAPSSVYARWVEFVPRVKGADAIDPYGLSITVNNRTFFVGQDDDDDSTIDDWLLQHRAAVEALGVSVSRATLPNGIALVFSTAYPSQKASMSLKLGEVTGCRVAHSTHAVREITSANLSVKVNSHTYQVPAQPTVAATLSLFVATHAATVHAYGIVVEAEGDELAFYTLDPEKLLTVAVYNKPAKLQGDNSVVTTMLRTESAVGPVLSCNKVTRAGFDFPANGFATGQVVALTGAPQAPMNTQYVVTGVESSELTLSYQGPFWPAAGVQVRLHAAEFLREPRHAYLAQGTNPRITLEWGASQTPAIFLYDFSGAMLRGYDAYREWVAYSSSDAFGDWAKANKPASLWANLQDDVFYAGPRPLLSDDGVNPSARLNLRANADPDRAKDPAAQQTVFSALSFPLFYEDDPRDITSAPEPLQAFVGYRSYDEGVDAATLTVSLVEDRSVSLVPTVHASDNDDEFVFAADGTVTVRNPTGVDFEALGFDAGQRVSFAGVDVHPDGRQRAHLDNNGRVFTITAVSQHALAVDVTTQPMAAERSVKHVATANAPYYDAYGDPITQARPLRVTVAQAPLPVAELTVLGQTEVEDPRLRLALNNVGRNLRPQDLYIFKEYPIEEAGVDWTILNRKRKELLLVQHDIYDYVSSYKSVTHAIDFFGYNDLAFVEYFLNLDPGSDKFGKLFSSELIALFDKLVPGFSKKNALANRLPNNVYKKTNLFSLSYRITDDQGNFVDGYNFDEITTKLFGLQRWLEANVVPIGSRIIDINGKATGVALHRGLHNTFKTTTQKNRDVFAAAIPQVVATLQDEGKKYSVSVLAATQDAAFDVPADTELVFRAFAGRVWDRKLKYAPGDVVLHDGHAWTMLDLAGTHVVPPPAGTPPVVLPPVEPPVFPKPVVVVVPPKPGHDPVWAWTPIKRLPAALAQTVRMVPDEPALFDVDAAVTPHFLVELRSNNGYGASWVDANCHSFTYDAWPL